MNNPAINWKIPVILMVFACIWNGIDRFCFNMAYTGLLLRDIKISRSNH